MIINFRPCELAFIIEILIQTSSSPHIEIRLFFKHITTYQICRKLIKFSYINLCKKQKQSKKRKRTEQGKAKGLLYDLHIKNMNFLRSLYKITNFWLGTISIKLQKLK